MLKLGLPKKGEIITVFSPFFILIFYNISNLIGLKHFCVFYFLTGHECYGCGITHAIISLLQGNLKEAYRENFLIFIVMPILLFVWLKYVYNIVCRLKKTILK